MSMQQGGGGGGSVGGSSLGQAGGASVATMNNSMNVVSEQIYEFLLTEMSLYAARSCTPTILSSSTSAATSNKSNNNNNNKSSDNNNNNDGDGNYTITTTSNANASINASSAATTTTDEESMTVSAEMAAAKLERMGYSVGYRITERLAQNKTWNIHPSAAAPPAPTPAGGGGGGSKGGLSGTTSESAIATATAAQQLEAVKFLCKEVWMEIFRKQIDKLQTNHRGVFVLKDLELKWLIRFPAGTEHSRISAIRLLAFPCGVIRGALANLGIPSVVSCDFLADGQRMAACSFNIKVK